MPPKPPASGKQTKSLEQRKFDADCVDDLVLLSTVSEESICKNLQTGFLRDDIYTYIGPVLLSVNPFHNIRPLYANELALKYHGRFMYELAPHVYAVAEDAYRAMRSTSADQCILVSGESGAGKTEAAKKVMEYVALISDRGETASDIRERLLRSNPVLEAFGNAKTVRNDNSSRFGKYMELLFDYRAVPVGGRITNYLLERPRVVNAASSERSFHIFYMLLSEGVKVADRQAWEVNNKGAEAFEMLKGRESKVAGMDDGKEYENMRAAMGDVGLTPQMSGEILRATAAVLQLGNLSFAGASAAAAGGAVVRPRSASTQRVAGGSSGALAISARLLGVEPLALERALTFRTVTTERIATPLRDSECVETRDALCKTLYARLFDALVAQLNANLDTSAGALTMGVLDIYGFEIFDVNSFEQLCINYCNEKLQQLFIELTLKTEQEEYVAEGIAWTPVDYFNNKTVCDLIEAKGDRTIKAGIIAYLDEECIYPAATDATLHKKLTDNLKAHAHFEPAGANFTIKHYAGDVTYSPPGMLDKNKDTLFRDLTQLMQTSSSRFLASLFPVEKGASKAAAAIGKRPVTAGAQFREQMGALVSTLQRCEPHYIRTIKPNDAKRSGVFDLPRVQHQVRYLGLLENVRVRRAGFAHRETYVRFVRRYKPLCGATWPSGSGDDRTDTKTLLDAMGLGGDGVQFGKTKVFLKEPKALFALENAREAALPGVVVLIQKRWAGILAREAYVVLRFAIKTQRCWKAYQSRLALIALRDKAQALFEGNKRRGISVSLYPIGDYLGATSNGDLTAPLNRAGDSSQILFADGVSYFAKTTFSEKSDFSPHVLIVTQQHLHFLQPVAATKEKPLSYKIVRSVPHTKLTGLSLSTFADGYVVCHVAEAADDASKEDKKLSAEGDAVFESGRKAEIVQTLKEKVPPRKGGGELSLSFSDTLSFTAKNNSLLGGKPKQKTIDFSEDGAAAGRGATIEVPTKKNKMPPSKLIVKIPPALGSQAPLQRAAAAAQKQAAAAKRRAPPARPGAAKPASDTVARARVLYPFAAEGENELSLKAGDVVELLGQTGEWWHGRLEQSGKEGHFPANYVKLIKVN